MAEKRKTNQAGFTLVEIVIVFVIIGLLTTYMLGNTFLSTRKQSRDTQRKAQMSQLVRALEMYVNDHGVYPSSDLSGKIVGCGDPASPIVCEWGEEWSDDQGTIYMAELPEEIQVQRNFFYLANDISWQLYANLESNGDPDIDNNGDGDYVPADDDFTTMCGAVSCNYGISSGNTRPGDALP